MRINADCLTIVNNKQRYEADERRRSGDKNALKEFLRLVSNVAGKK